MNSSILDELLKESLFVQTINQSIKFEINSLTLDDIMEAYNQTVKTERQVKERLDLLRSSVIEAYTYKFRNLVKKFILDGFRLSDEYCLRKLFGVSGKTNQTLWDLLCSDIKFQENLTRIYNEAYNSLSSLEKEKASQTELTQKVSDEFLQVLSTNNGVKKKGIFSFANFLLKQVNQRRALRNEQKLTVKTAINFINIAIENGWIHNTSLLREFENSKSSARLNYSSNSNSSSSSNSSNNIINSDDGGDDGDDDDDDNNDNCHTTDESQLLNKFQNLTIDDENIKFNNCNISSNVSTNNIRTMDANYMDNNIKTVNDSVTSPEKATNIDPRLFDYYFDYYAKYTANQLDLPLEVVKDPNSDYFKTVTKLALRALQQSLGDSPCDTLGGPNNVSADIKQVSPSNNSNTNMNMNDMNYVNSNTKTTNTPQIPRPESNINNSNQYVKPTPSGYARKSINLDDAKPALQYYYQKKNLGFPDYQATVSGLEHHRQYQVYVKIENTNIIGNGADSKKKEAEKKAAQSAVEKLLNEYLPKHNSEFKFPNHFKIVTTK